MVRKEILNGKVTYTISPKVLIDNIDVISVSLGPNFSQDKRDDLEVLVIPPTILHIYDNFWNCNKLSKFEVLAGNIEFCSDINGVLYSADKKMLMRVPPAFVGEYTLPQETCAIHSHAFTSCNSITKISLHNNLNKIGINAFYDCITETPIIIPDSLFVFEGCTSINTFNKEQHFLAKFIFRKKTFSYEEISQLFRMR